jgi:hypothetical protein
VRQRSSAVGIRTHLDALLHYFQIATQGCGKHRFVQNYTASSGLQQTTALPGQSYKLPLDLQRLITVVAPKLIIRILFIGEQSIRYNW